MRYTAGRLSGHQPVETVAAGTMKQPRDGFLAKVFAELIEIHAVFDNRSTLISQRS
jgi:hypothetical protein